jgi:RNA polymerase sigma-70 factor, ECF subfamily
VDDDELPPPPSPEDVTNLLRRGDDPVAREALLKVVYDELRRRAGAMMRRESAGHTLQPTALVHEAWFRLVGQNDVDWQGRAHFFGIATQMMRRVLLDHARRRLREKRGGDVVKVSLEDGMPLSVERPKDVVAVDEALARLGQLDERQAKIVELRFFGGLSVEEVAEVLGVSKRTVEADWTMAKAWLRRELAP